MRRRHAITLADRVHAAGRVVIVCAIDRQRPPRAVVTRAAHATRLTIYAPDPVTGAHAVLDTFDPAGALTYNESHIIRQMLIEELSH